MTKRQVLFVHFILILMLQLLTSLIVVAIRLLLICLGKLLLIWMHLDASGGALVPSDVPLGGALVPSDASLRGAASRSDLERATDDSFPVNPSGPPPRRSAAAERARLAAQQHFMLRPLRLLVVGKEAPYTVEDQAFLHL